MTATGCDTSPDADLVAHLLRVVGIDAIQASDTRSGAVIVADAATKGHLAAARAANDCGRPAVVLAASTGALPPRATARAINAHGPLLCKVLGEASPGALRSFHGAQEIEAGPESEAIVTADDRPVWCWRPGGRAGEILIGTDLARDLTLIRQGNPAAAINRPSGARWGFAGERPTYLFEGQIDPRNPFDRMADRWIWTLRGALVSRGVPARDVLPFGAPGAIIVTGDDDQAPLDDYLGQSKRLGLLPVTYFLHPLAKLSSEALVKLASGRRVEWELHPDALETPDAYAERLREQAIWFHALTGRRPRLARNHGFLNDGYWGHASAWAVEGITGSSNLPGLDGCVLNGSLLPARLLLDRQLTGHWSVLTAFGDGVFFVHQWDARTALDAIVQAGRRILDEGIPGLLVLNLHPANHAKAAALHEGAHHLVRELGFAAMSMGDAFDWFEARDAHGVDGSTERMLAPFSQSLIQASQPADAEHRVPAARGSRNILRWLSRFGARGGSL